MSKDPEHQATDLLMRLKRGDRAAGDELLPIVYRELRRLAEIQMADQPAHHTLQPTALVHEAWMKLVDTKEARFEGRGQFFSLASRIMRTVLVDHARAKQAEKRGGKGLRVALDEDLVAGAEPDLDLLALDEALNDLAKSDAELARIVELRYFGGLSAQETADVLETSLRSIERGWQIARMWLYKRMGGESAAGAAEGAV